MISKVVKVVIGSVILGFGISLAVLSGHGGDAISVFSQGLGKCLNISIGNASILFYIVFLIPAYLIDKHELGLGTILSPLCSAISLDLFLGILNIQVNGAMSVIVLLIGITCIGIGLGIYVSADVGCSSYDVIILGISKKFKAPLWLSKSASDMILCFVCYLLGGVVGLGPILGILFIGIVLDATLKIVKKRA